jgi:hypothetical protein
VAEETCSFGVRSGFQTFFQTFSKDFFQTFPNSFEKDSLEKFGKKWFSPGQKHVLGCLKLDAHMEQLALEDSTVAIQVDLAEPAIAS